MRTMVLELSNGYHNVSKDFVIEIKNNGCWESVNHKAKDGWGYTQYKKTKAHRYFYEKFKGKIPKGMLVCHTCDNPACCNPEHLFLGTDKDNTQDMIKKGRQASHIGNNNPKSKLKESDIVKIFNDNRRQITIAKEYNVSDCTIRDIKKFRSWTHITNNLRGNV
jgi:hypothetical protein